MTTSLYKFGGTSVGDANSIHTAAELVRDASANSTLCVVTSAMAGVTNLLVTLSADGTTLEARTELFDTLAAKHRDTAHALGMIDTSRLDQLLDEIRVLYEGMALTRVGSRRMRDRLIAGGERLSVELLAHALGTHGVKAAPMHADTFLETEGGFSEVEPRSFTQDRRTQAALRRVIDRGEIPIVTGFSGRGPDGDTRLLGRGGSDLTATLLASALDADECVIWTDVPGVSTCDPRLVPDALPIEHLHYREASEMAFFGSKVLHPRTMIPVATKGIPVVVRSTKAPNGDCTRIDGSLGMRQETPASVSVLRDMALISVEGSGLSGVAGTSARLFGTLARAGISVVMISQGSAESAICIALKGSDVEAAESALRDEFRLDIAKRRIEEIVTRWGVSILTVVTAGMKHRVGAAQRMTSGMARAGVNILSIAQGSSELSVSFAIDHADTHRGARALHEAMRRPTVRVPNRSPRLSVALAGVGLVGRAVLDELSALAYVRAVGLCDSRSIRTHNAGFGSSELAEVIESKKQGHPLDDAEPPGDTHTALSMLDAMLAFGAPNPVLIDCTADPGMVDVVRYALAHGVDVITANKEILACSTDEYRAIRRLANEHGAMLLGEATVGAGMPVARTITAMRNAGDEITSVSASLSGTIAFLMGGLSGGGELDDLVQHAINLGYAEPDPSADVLGDDMRRKALVLARLSGFEPQSVPVVEPFADVRDVQAGTSEFDSALRSAGTTVRRRMKTAKAGGTELRYLLHAEPGSAPTVGFVECDPEGPFGGMTPEQARVVITSRYNDTRPLIISGAGAGDVTTAGGVLADLGLIGASRRCGVSM